MKKNNYFPFSNFLILSVHFRHCIEFPKIEFKGQNTENQKNTLFLVAHYSKESSSTLKIKTEPAGIPGMLLSPYPNSEGINS